MSFLVMTFHCFKARVLSGTFFYAKIVKGNALKNAFG